MRTPLCFWFEHDQRYTFRLEMTVDPERAPEGEEWPVSSTAVSNTAVSNTAVSNTAVSNTDSQVHGPASGELPARARLLARWLPVALLLACAALYWPSFRAFAVSLDFCDRLFCDFADHFYPMGTLIQLYAEPVRGFFYSPFAALLLRLVALPSYPAALLVWAILQLGALIAYHRLSARMLELRTARAEALYAFLLWGSVPVLENLVWGQVSVFMTLGTLAALVWQARGRWLAASAALALVISVKLYPAWLLAWFILKRDWRTVGATLALTLTAALLLPALALGPAETLSFYRLVEEQAGQELALNVWRNPDSQYLPHVLGRLYDLGEGVVRGPVLSTVSFGIGALSLAGLLLVVRRGIEPGYPYAAALFSCSLPFWLPTAWPHYFIFLPLVQLFVLAERGVLPGFWRRLVGILVIASASLSHIGVLQLMGWKLYQLKGMLLMSNGLMLLALFLLLTSRERAPVALGKGRG